MFRELVASSGSGFWYEQQDSSTHFLIQGRESFPIGRYYPYATVGAVVGAAVTLLINATELIGVVRNGFIVERLSVLAFPVVQDRRQWHYAPPTFVRPYDPMGGVCGEKLSPP